MGIFQKKILDTLHIDQKLPANYRKEDESLFSHDIKKDLKEVNIYHLQLISVTPQGIIFRKLSINKNFLIWPAHSKDFGVFYLIKNYISRKKIYLGADKNYLICFDHWSVGYFHWMCDFLPRLLVAIKGSEKFTLLLPENLNAGYVSATLEAFGVTEVQRFKMNEYVSCAKAIVPGYVTNSGDNRPEIMLKLRDTLLEKNPQSLRSTEYAENIYVSRSKAKGRFIKNEQEVENVLKKFNFRVIHFEEHTFPEQIAIALHAKNYIGLHGANLTNLIFMRSGTNVLEFRRENDRESNYYFSLASTFNLNYYYQQCAFTYDEKTNNYNHIVDLNLLEKNIELMLSNKNS